MITAFPFNAQADAQDARHSRVIFYRTPILYGLARGCPIDYQGKEIVELGRGRFAEWDVPAGQYTLESRKKKLELMLAPGQTVLVECKVQGYLRLTDGQDFIPRVAEFERKPMAGLIGTAPPQMAAAPPPPATSQVTQPSATAPAPAEASAAAFEVDPRPHLGPEDVARVNAIQQRGGAIGTATWLPEVTLAMDSTGEKPKAPGKCKSRVQQVDISFAPSEWHKVARYRGEAISCFPTGIGRIDYTSGTIWVGQVARLINTDRQFRVPARSGYGIMQGSANYIFSRDRIAVANNGEKLADYSEVRDELIFYEGSGGNRFSRGADHTLMRTREGHEVRREASGHTRLQTSSGMLIEGRQTGFDKAMIYNLKDIAWTGPLQVTVPGDSWAVPPGRYLVLPGDYRGSGPFAASDLIPEAQVLQSRPANKNHCPTPSSLPSGWVVWWPGCFKGDTSSAPNVMAYASDGRIRLTEYFPTGRPGFVELEVLDLEAGKVLRRIEADALVPGSRQPAGNAKLMVDGKVAYHGPFDDLVPVGDGSCALPDDEGEGFEPCRYASGQRIDELHQVRTRLRKEKEEHARLAKLEEERQRQREMERLMEIRRAEREAEAAEQAAHDEAVQARTRQIMMEAVQTLGTALGDHVAAQSRNAELAAQLRIQRSNEERRQQQEAVDRAAQAAEARRRRDEVARNELAEARRRALANAQPAQPRASPVGGMPSRLPSGGEVATVSLAAAPATPARVNPTMAAAPAAPPPAPPKKTYPAVPEAVAVCIDQGNAYFRCHSSLNPSGTIVDPSQASGWQTPEQWVNFVGNCSNRREVALRNGVAWTCGYGVSGIVKDAAGPAGAVFTRGTFYCDPTENYCKRLTPTG